MTTRRRFSAEFKARVALAALPGAIFSRADLQLGHTRVLTATWPFAGDPIFTLPATLIQPKATPAVEYVAASDT